MTSRIGTEWNRIGTRNRPELPRENRVPFAVIGTANGTELVSPFPSLRRFQTPMKRPRIVTKIVGFAPWEWQQIRIAAVSLHAREAEVATLIPPGRLELSRLSKEGGRVALRLTSEGELAQMHCEHREGR